MKNPNHYTDKQWLYQYKKYVRECRKSPWKFYEENIVGFQVFKNKRMIDYAFSPEVIRMNNVNNTR